MLLSFNNNWLRRRWLDFRNGHSTYLIFAMTFANFITIQYKLLIDKVPSIDWLFGTIWLFAIVFVVIYVPLAIIIGYWHRKTQWTVEQEALFRENKVGALMWLYIMELIDGKVSEEDKKKMRETLLKITKGSTRLYEFKEAISNETKAGMTESKASTS
jgi:magnesium-transporting ATPase (P-type)